MNLLRSRSRRISTCLLLLSLTCMGVTNATASDRYSLADRTEDRRLAVSAGAFLVRFDSAYKYTNATYNVQAFVDLEGQLDLPTSEVVGNISALWRMTDHGYLTGTYSSLRRSGERSVVQEPFIIEGSVVSLDGVMSARFDYDFVDLTYAYAFHVKEQSLALGKAGVHIFRTHVGLSLEGELVVDGVPETGKVGDEAEFVAAFPLLGVAINYQLGRRLFIENMVDFVYLPVGNSQGNALRAQLGCRYMFAPWIGIRAGLSYNHERVEYTEDGVTHEVEFDFSGLMAQVHLAF